MGTASVHRTRGRSSPAGSASLPVVDASLTPVLTAAQMAQVDRLAVEAFGIAARTQLVTLLQMSVECHVAIYDLSTDEVEAEFGRADVVVDALLGCRGDGIPREGVGWLIERIAGAPRQVVSLDLPSGVDADTGEAPGPAVLATATLTLGLPKAGLLRASGRALAGRLHLADIGLPAALYQRRGVEAGTPFAEGRIVRLETGAT